MDTPDNATPSLDELVLEIDDQIRDLEARAAQARSDYPRAALAARLTTNPEVRADAAKRARELNETVKTCRARIEELAPMLAEAKVKLKEEGRGELAAHRLKALREAAKGLQRCREVAAEAESLIEQLGEKIRQIIVLGRQSHAQFARFMSVDQMHSCAPDEGALCQSILGGLARSGGVDLHELAQLSHLGLDALHTREAVSRVVDFQCTLIESRFDLDLAAKRPRLATIARKEAA
jgi:hypothetical protein